MNSKRLLNWVKKILEGMIMRLKKKLLDRGTHAKRPNLLGRYCRMKKLKLMQRHLYYNNKKIKKEFTLDYHIKDPNKGFFLEQELQI